MISVRAFITSMLNGLILLSHSAVGLQNHASRRQFLFTSSSSLVGGITLLSNPQISNAAVDSPSLNFETSKSGIQWADAKVGNGPVPKVGTYVSIDYVLSTTGARYGTYIYKTADKGAPYRWKIGDGSTIQGLEEAVIGGEGISPMQPGGIRRIIIPSTLAYQSLADTNQECGNKGTAGPVPPPTLAFEEFQRFKNIYCNPNRPYQPDVVLDIKLYGKRNLE